MNRPILSSLLALAIVAGSAVTASAQAPETGNASGPAPAIDESKTPWLKGVSISPNPAFPAPVVPVELLTAEGTALPATMSEDLPILLSVQSPVFDAAPPAEWEGQPLAGAQWTGQCSVNWFFEDLGKNKSTQASCSEQLPLNQMRVTPLDPTQQGAVTVYVSRPMRYEVEAGRFRQIYVTGGRGAQSKVTDVTPPLCGLEITTDKGKASVFAVEAPAHAAPGQKTVDVIGKGTLLDQRNAEREVTLANIPLGPNGLVPGSNLTVYLSLTEKIKLQAIVTDNDMVEDSSIRFGFCTYANGNVQPVGESNVETIEPAKLKLPSPVWLFIEAGDPSKNLGRLILPVQFR